MATHSNIGYNTNAKLITTAIYDWSAPPPSVQCEMPSLTTTRTTAAHAGIVHTAQVHGLRGLHALRPVPRWPHWESSLTLATPSTTGLVTILSAPAHGRRHLALRPLHRAAVQELRHTWQQLPRPVAAQWPTGYHRTYRACTWTSRLSCSSPTTLTPPYSERSPTWATLTSTYTAPLALAPGLLHAPRLPHQRPLSETSLTLAALAGTTVLTALVHGLRLARALHLHRRCRRTESVPQPGPLSPYHLPLRCTTPWTTSRSVATVPPPPYSGRASPWPLSLTTHRTSGCATCLPS
jgi:hypothetical protein